MLFGDAEEFSDELGSISQVLLDQFRSDHSEERRRRLVGHGLGQEGLAGAWSAEQKQLIFLKILLTYEGSNREVYRDFQPSYAIFRR